MPRAEAQPLHYYGGKIRDFGGVMVRKSGPLGCVLAIVVLGACLVPAMFGAKLFLGTRPGAIPGSRT